MTVVVDELWTAMAATPPGRMHWQSAQWVAALEQLREAYERAGEDTARVDEAIAACRARVEPDAACTYAGEALIGGDQQMEALLTGVVQAAAMLAQDVGSYLDGVPNEASQGAELLVSLPWYEELRRAVDAYASYVLGMNDPSAVPDQLVWDAARQEYVLPQ